MGVKSSAYEANFQTHRKLSQPFSMTTTTSSKAKYVTQLVPGGYIMTELEEQELKILKVRFT